MPRVDSTLAPARARHETSNRAAVGAVLADLAADVRARRESGARVLLPARWDERLAEVLLDRNLDCATEFGGVVAGRVSPRRAAEDFDPAAMVPWLSINARISAENINAATRDALASEDEIEPVLEELQGRRLVTIAATMVALAANFGAQDGARAAGAKVKTWQTNSGRPRSAHAAMSGATVGIDETFSNSMKWPGDPAGGADQVANCMCSLVLL